jgi:hypothetical protein
MLNAIWKTLSDWSVPAPLILSILFLFYKTRFRKIPPAEAFALAISAASSFIFCVQVFSGLPSVESTTMKIAGTSGVLILFYSACITMREALRFAGKKLPKPRKKEKKEP